MRAQLPQLFPRPRELNLRGGFLTAPACPHPTGNFLKSLPQSIVEAQAALDANQTSPCRIELRPKLAPESYYLEISSGGIHLQASDAAGVLYGLHEDWAATESLRLGVSAAAASLYDPRCSASLRPVEECRRLAEQLGFRAVATD